MARSKRVIDVSPPDRPMPLKIFVCTDHDRHENEAKVASLVLARDVEEARPLLDKALTASGLRPYAHYRYQLHEIPADRPLAEILNDGDY